MNPATPTGRPKLSVRSRSLREEIASELRRAILTGQFQPGQRLIERELSEMLGVSSIPVREALQELENMGLVVKRHNHGCSVVQLGPEEVERICELRRALEPQVVQWAQERMTREDVETLQTQFEKLAGAAEAGDLAEFFHQDLEFHRLLWELSRNSYAARALATAVGSLFAAGLIRMKEAGMNLRAEVAKHRKIVEALRKGQGGKAATALLDIADGFEQQLQRNQGAPPA